MRRIIFNSKLFKLIIGILLGIIFLNLLFPLNKDLYDFKYSKIYYSDKNVPMRMMISEDEYWRFYISNKDVPKLLKNSILVFEDKYFYNHFGVNIFSIIRALFNNIFNESRIGASTISMQVVKIVEPKNRTYINKIIEIFRALQLEINFSKEEILNMYFNKAPYGGNIEGLRAASYFYFGKELSNLTISEMGILTTIPKNPNINRPDKQINLKEKRDKVLKRLFDNNLINSSQFKRAKKEDIKSYKHPVLFDVIQYTNQIKNDSKTNIYTTIDYDKQKFIQNYLKRETKKYNNNNLYNSAAVVIDNKTLEIKVYVGSNDFFDSEHNGQNDGVLMKKSPGSTLKPFVYALAMDEGLITPKRKLLDIPLNFNGYVPRNYNGKFNGEISAEEALKLSLNIPAVDLQNQLGKNSLYELLEKVGIGITQLKDTYGLSIVVGGIDLNLLELTKLFTVFPNGGKYLYDNQRLFSKESAYLVSEILSDGYREKFDGYWESSINSKKVSFKTGTSSDAKHLYTIGYTPEYTIGLWFGNFDGKKTNGDLTGMNTVSDSLLQIFEIIGSDNKWFIKPDSIYRKSICVDYYNNDDCKNYIDDYTYNNKSNKCMELNTQKVEYFNRIKNINTQDLLNNNCYNSLKDSKPIILSPINNKEYIFNKEIPEKFRVLKIKCQPYSKNDEIKLYLNGNYVDNSSFLNLEEGNYNLVCMKDKEKYDEINFTIKYK
jgi:penicillin-binding protein 1C